MDNQKINNNNNYISVFGILTGLSILTVVIFFICVDVFTSGITLYRSLLSFSFYLGISFTAIAYSFFTSKSASNKIKLFLNSFIINFCLLFISFSLIFYLVTRTQNANASEMPLFGLFFFPAILAYCFLFALSQFIHQNSTIYVVLYNILLSVCLIISANFNWWIFPWFLLFLIAHFTISITKHEKAPRITRSFR